MNTELKRVKVGLALVLFLKASIDTSEVEAKATLIPFDAAISKMSIEAFKSSCKVVSGSVTYTMGSAIAAR